MKKMIFWAFLALSIAFIHPTFADKHMKKEGQCHCMRMKKMTQALALTPTQQAKIEAIKKRSKETMKAKHDEIKAIRDQMKDLVKSNKMDEAKLDALINQKKEIIASMMKNKMMMKHQIYNVLDAKQKTKFSDMMDKWEQRKMDKMKKILDQDMDNE